MIPTTSRASLIVNTSKAIVKASKMELAVSKWMIDSHQEGLTLLTAKEVGKKVRRTEKTLANWRSGGTGPAYVKVSAGRSGRVLYVAADVDRWIQEHRVEVA